MKKLNFKIAVLLSLTMNFLSVVFGQVPDGFTIVQTHYDDITWYEARENWSGSLYAIYNGGGKGIGFKDVLTITYSHGYFFYKMPSSRGGEYYNVYDTEGQSVQLCSTNMISGYEVIDGKLYMYHYCGVYDENRNKVGEEFIIGTQGERLLKTETSGEYGIRDIKTKEEILAPEFQDCGYLGGNLFKFKMNGYWGVMNRQGKIIIPLSRQYTQIDYSLTLKTFTFVKEGGYKGECNANGVQTSIVKMKEDKRVVSTTTNTNKGNTNSKTSNTISETSNSKTSAKVEDGLLYEGDYSEGPWINPNTGYSQPAPNPHHHVKIYEDHIVIDMLNLSCSGKSSSGEKMFINSWSNITYYVDNFFNIRSTFPYGYSQFTKGNVVYDMNAPVQNYDNGGYNDGTKGTNGDYKGGQTGPSTKDCPVCHTTGICQKCLGRGWVTGLDNQRHDCPTCHGNKVCWKCNGSGKVSTH